MMVKNMLKQVVEVEWQSVNENKYGKLEFGVCPTSPLEDVKDKLFRERFNLGITENYKIKIKIESLDLEEEVQIKRPLPTAMKLSSYD